MTGAAAAQKMRRIGRGMAAALLAAALPSPAVAQGAPIGFRSPSNNIHCQFWSGDTDAHLALRCDLVQTTNRPPPRPRDCELEWGQAFEIVGDASRGTRLCYGDTVRDDRLPVLSYGRTWQRRGLTCISEQTGVTCVNAKGHGFEISRARQRVF